MYQTISFTKFHDWFKKSEQYGNNFTYEGLKALFEYLEDRENLLDENLEFDPIALCCEWSEHESPEEAVKCYEEGFLPDMGDNENPDLVELGEASRTQALEYLEERTTVIRVEGGGVIIQNF